MFIEQMSKLFGERSHNTPEKTPVVAPRSTCTRLKKFRQTRQDIVIEPELKLHTNSYGDEPSDPKDKQGSFAAWVTRTQQAHQELIEKRNQARQKMRNKKERQSDETVQAFEGFSSKALQQVATDPDTPITTLKWLAAHYDVEVRRALAINHNIGADILHILVRDGDHSVKLAVLDNKNLSQDEIFRLCDEENSLIAEKAMKRLNSAINPKFNRRRAQALTANIDISTPKWSVRHRNA